MDRVIQHRLSLIPAHPPPTPPKKHLIKYQYLPIIWWEFTLTDQVCITLAISNSAINPKSPRKKYTSSVNCLEMMWTYHEATRHYPMFYVLAETLHYVLYSESGIQTLITLCSMILKSYSKIMLCPMLWQFYPKVTSLLLICSYRVFLTSNYVLTVSSWQYAMFYALAVSSRHYVHYVLLVL